MAEKEGINHYIDRILEEIKKNNNLMKLIYDNNADALSPTKPNLTIQQKNSMIYTKIFPFRFIPQISTTACSYLNLGFGNFKEISNTYQAGKIGFYVASHRDLWKMNGGLRPIFMLEEIKNVAKGLEHLGLGKLKLTNSDEYGYDENFIGYRAIYEIVDFNR